MLCYVLYAKKYTLTFLTGIFIKAKEYILNTGRKVYACVEHVSVHRDFLCPTLSSVLEGEFSFSDHMHVVYF